MPHNDGKSRELIELKVSAVALVDEPANRRPFFIVKRKDGESILREEGQGKPEDTMKKKVKKNEKKDVAKQAVVVSEEDLGVVTEALGQMAEAVTSFAEMVAGKTAQDGMVIFTEEDLAPWTEVQSLASNVGSVLSGAPAPDAEGDAEMGDDEHHQEDARMAKFEERMNDLEEAVLLLIQSAQGGVEKSEEDPDALIEDLDTIQDDTTIQ